MKKKTLNAQEYDTLLDAFAQKLSSIRELWFGIKELKEQAQKHPTVKSEYLVFLGNVYQCFLHELYNRIYALVDENDKVESVIKLLKNEPKNKPEIEHEEWAEHVAKIEKESVDRIKNDPTFKKIRDYRNKVVCHNNSQLIFDVEFSERFFNENGITFEEVGAFLDSLWGVLTATALRSDGWPQTLPKHRIGLELYKIPIQLEIKKIFSVLAQETKAPQD